MKKSEQISKEFASLKEKTIKHIMSFVKGQSYKRIVFSKTRQLIVTFGNRVRRVECLWEDGDITLNPTTESRGTIFNITEFSLADLRDVLVELEIMKENNQLEKP